MTSGGARARSGPAPDLEAFARERDKGDWVLLPEKWEFDAPAWPLNGIFNIKFGSGEDARYDNFHDRELEHWSKLWGQGQAPMWLINKQETAVALYCRALTLVENTMGPTSSAMMTELRRAQEDLGLSTAGLLRNKWRFRAQNGMSVQADEAKQEATAAKKPKSNVTDLFAGVKVASA